MDCIFCRIVAGELPAYIIHRNEWTVSFLDINPVGRGHCLVVPRHHCRLLADLPETLFGPLMSSLSAVSSAVTRALQAEGFNIFVNNGTVAGQIIHHVHFHILPRFEGDGISFRAFHRKLSDEEMRRIHQTVVNYLRTDKG